MSQPLNVRVPDELMYMINETWEDTGFTSRSEFVRTVLRDAIEAEPKLDPDALAEIDRTEETTKRLSEVKAELGADRLFTEARETFDTVGSREVMGDFEEFGTVGTIVESDLGFLQEQEDQQDELDVLVAGCGGGGVRIVDRIHRRLSGQFRTAILDTDLGQLQEAEANLRALVGKHRYDGEGAEGDAEGVRDVADGSTTMLRRIVQEPDLVFVVAGLGGGTGSGLAPKLAEIADDAGAVTVSLATLPFDQDSSVVDRSRTALDTLDVVSDTLAVLDGNQVSANPDVSMSEALGRMNRNIAHLVTQLCLDAGHFYVSEESSSLLSSLQNGGRSVLLDSEIDISRNETFDELSDKLLQYTNVDIRSERARQAILTFTAGEGITNPGDQIDDIVAAIGDHADSVTWSSRQRPASGAVGQYSIRVAGFLAGLETSLDDFFASESAEQEADASNSEADIAILPGTGVASSAV